MRQNILLVSLGLILVLCHSCGTLHETEAIPPSVFSGSSENGITVDQDLLGYWDFYQAKVDGTLRLKDQHNVPRIQVTTSGSQVVSGLFYTQPNTAGTWGEMRIGNMLLQSNPGHGYNYEPEDLYNQQHASHLFGQEVAFSAHTPNGDPEFTHSMYVPEKLRITAPTQAGGEMEVGDVINWTPDPNFSEKIVLLLEYDPQDFGNEGIGGTSIRIPKAIPDNGTYVLTEENLSAFAAGAMIRLTFIRGAFHLQASEISDRVFRLAGYSYLTFDLRVAT